MFTIFLIPGRSSIIFTDSCEQWKAEEKLTAICLSNSAAGILGNSDMKQSPALFTRASTPPNSALILLKTSEIFSAEVKSTAKVVTSFGNKAFSFSRLSVFKSSAIT